MPFDEAPSVRFVFSARLDPAPGRRRGGRGNARGKGKGKGNNGKKRLLEERQARDLKADGASDGVGGVGVAGAGAGSSGKSSVFARLREERHRWALKGGGGAASKKSPIFASLETEWTPLTRIREEHAPMPAPETKCMQVKSSATFGVSLRIVSGVSFRVLLRV